MDKSSSSKVTVEYEDPAGLFNLLKPDLESRLPLRNLNWKSSTRPLRNIDALHVEFVPSVITKREASLDPPGLRRTPSTLSSRGPSLDNRRRPALGHRSLSHPIGQNVPHRERRHQIPGLRQTPYLRLFFLRCDDKDSYKAELREQLRDWVKGISPPIGTAAQGKSDNHDAFEWMIIHVVIPETKAASEPRWTAAKKDPDELAERSKSKAKWANKNNTTVFDKLRADFPPAVKSGLERVAQLRLAKDAVPESFLPATRITAEFTETAQERSNAWQDLVAKFRTSILRSFDRRVTQYEDDVREKEGQRSLPGWNFCTFFTVKENLAMAFESVGLVEDALAIYDELEVGLEAAISNNNTFLGDMAKVRKQLELLAGAIDDSPDDGIHPDAPIEPLMSPSDLDQQAFRNSIVSNTISLFDFHTYIFTRQRLLLYRLGSFEPFGSAKSNGTSSSGSAKPENQLMYIAEVCRRAMSYISVNARTLREELHLSSEDAHVRRHHELAKGLAANWSYTTSAKLLNETAIPLGSSKHDFGPQINGSSDSTSSTRRSVLQTLSSLASPRRSAVVYEHESSKPLNKGGTGPPNAASGSGPSELASSRFELCLLQRKSLDSLADLKGWPSSWSAIDNLKINFGNVPDTKDPNQLEESTSAIPELDFVLDEDVKTALSSIKAFRERYAVLTGVAIRNALQGERLAAAENAFGDLALSKYQEGDYTGAAQIFAKLAPRYTSNGWSVIDVKVLYVYSDCLRRLNRRDEFLRTALLLLRKQAAIGSVSSDDAGVTFSRLIDYAREVQRPYKAALGDLFQDLSIDGHIQHQEDVDGFAVRMNFRSRVRVPATIDKITLKLANPRDPSQEFLLVSSQAMPLEAGLIQAVLKTPSTAWGLFEVRRFCIELGNLHFTHDFEGGQKSLTAGFTSSSASKTDDHQRNLQLMLYPRNGSLDVQMSAFPEVHVDKPRSFLIRFESGSIEYDSINLRMKPATAGMRLYTSKIEVTASTEPLDFTVDGQAIDFYARAGNSFNFRLPYSIDVPQLDLVVKVEVVAKKGSDLFTFFFEEEIAVELHLDVDVNDTFKAENLFSQFSVRTTSDDPLLVESITASGSEAHSVTPLELKSSQPAFDKQPVSWTCKIDRMTKERQSSTSSKKRVLEMRVDYYPWTTIVSNCVREAFEYDLAESQFPHLHRLLIPLLQRSLAETLSSKALEDSLLAGQIEVPSFDALGWETYLAVLSDSPQHETLKQWLKSWHTSRLNISLQTDSLPEYEKRSITVPVEIPTIQVLATASFNLESSLVSPKSLPPIAYVGQPLEVTLRISITHRWSSDPSSPHPETRLKYNLPDSQDWLVAGATTATFLASETEPTSFHLLLVPLVSGALQLPQVEVQLAASPDTDGTARDANSRYACETDFESAAETILVLRPPADADYAVHEAAPMPPAVPAMLGLGVRMDSHGGEEGQRWFAAGEQ